jgi:hypothetical protein
MGGDTPAALLEGILETLKLIHGDFDAQEKRWRWLEEKLDGPEYSSQRATTVDKSVGDVEGIRQVNANGSSGRQPITEAPATVNRLDADTSDVVSFIQPAELPPLPNDETTSLSSSSTLSLANGLPLPTHEPPSQSSIIDSLSTIQDSQTWATEWRTRKIDIVDIRDWSSPLADSPLYHNQTLRRELGDAWTIPDDGRLPIMFTRDSLEKLSNSALESRIPDLVTFRDRVKRDAFVDLKIVDDCSSLMGSERRGQMTYRLGAPVRVEGECKVPARTSVATASIPADRRRIRVPDAPWRRFM